MAEPYIPQYITVHLGPPGSTAQNVTVTFPDYIKNVASSEIFPTWPENAIRANIYAQISFALNRFYTEWYPSQGYDFDITNSTAYDQSFVAGRDVFENISQIVDDIFNNYVQRQGSVEPLFTQYCNGTTVTCDGLSQWGTVTLAEQGYTPYEILQHYYGDDINIVQNAPVRLPTPSYPGRPLRLGDGGNDVRTIQIQLNRISNNYPSIPKITPVDGVFGKSTEDAVKEFQRIFNLTPDGIVGQGTWYRISYIFASVKRLAELDSEGLALEEVSQQYPGILRKGDTGDPVRVMQYYLAVIGNFYETVPPIQVTGTFDQATEDAVIAFQKTYGLNPDGIVGRETWNDMYRAYRGIVESNEFIAGGQPLFSGTVLSLGSTGDDVRQVQRYLTALSEVFPEVPAVPETGLYGPQTQNAVIQFQNRFNITPSGVVGPITWGLLASLYSDIQSGERRESNQFPGYELQEEG